VAQVEQILREIARGGLVVDGDPVAQALGLVLLVDRGDHGAVVVEAAHVAERGDDDARHVLGAEEIEVFLLALVIEVARADQHGEVLLLALGLDALH
jgi:hypothetical protein